MPSPFPGMDPYLEDPAVWPDFHSTFLHVLRERLTGQLPEAYDAVIEERINIAVGRDELRLTIPDVAVTADPQRLGLRPTGASLATTAASAVAVAEPVVELAPARIPLHKLPRHRIIFVSIVRRPEQRVVTVIELLSPTNKVGEGRGEYLLKREALLAQPLHVLELDLLVGGERLPLDEPLPVGDYYALLRRAEQPAMVEVYAWSVRRPLPRLPIPLAAPDPDVWVSLGEVLATAYERGRYHRRIRYARPPTAPLAEPDRAWAAELAAASQSASLAPPTVAAPPTSSEPSTR